MCGIFALISSSKHELNEIIDNLSKLEYRGYDSSGVCFLDDGNLSIIKAEGKIENLYHKILKKNLSTNIAICHTRWATHGKANETNAHPHQSGKITIVHNGIIENYLEIKKFLEEEGYKFASETDTEVLAAFIDYNYNKDFNMKAAIIDTKKAVKGSYAFVAINSDHKDVLYLTRHDANLLISFKDDVCYVSSDPAVFNDDLAEIYILEDEEVVELQAGSVNFYDHSLMIKEKQSSKIKNYKISASLANCKWSMEREIREQPEVLARIIENYIDFSQNRINFELKNIPEKISRISIIACGSSFFAGQVAKYWFEYFTGIFCNVESSSEFRYREVPPRENELFIFISQSGETIDTLSALRYVNKFGASVISIVNVETSAMTRESENILHCLAGSEVGVASTKSFTAQLLILFLIVIKLTNKNDLLKIGDFSNYFSQLQLLPMISQDIISANLEGKKISQELISKKNILYIGRNNLFPIAMEGALKLKELTYIHAEGIASGELKHGTIALIDKGFPVIALVDANSYPEKIISGINQVLARGAHVVAIGQESILSEVKAQSKIVMPGNFPQFLSPIYYSLVVQALAYNCADIMGLDVDKPRNLAKSVTVE